MKPFLITTLLFLFVALSGFAQDQKTYFLKNYGRYVDNRDSADYIRYTTPADSGMFLVTEFYKTGGKKREGKVTMIDPLIFEGEVQSYTENGTPKNKTNYKKGVLYGDEIIYFPNGKIYSVLTFSDTTTVTYGDKYLIKTNNDSLGNNSVNNGNGYYKAYDDKFTYIKEEGTVKNGKRNGAWKGASKAPGLTFNEQYNNGTLLSGTAIDSTGKSTSYTKSRSTFPLYRGGMDAFYKYLSRKIKYPSYAMKKKIEGTVIIAFIVEKDGKLSHVMVLKSVSPDMDAEASNALIKSTGWLPGTEFGRPVRVAYNVPIKFAIPK